MAKLDEAGKAAVELTGWLSFPTELGRLPDSLEIVDTRTLPWPPLGGDLSARGVVGPSS